MDGHGKKRTLTAIKRNIVNQLLLRINPFSKGGVKIIKTPWGTINPSVDIFPVVYILFIYGIVYILPYGKELIGISWFDWCRSEDGPLEWIQFIFFFLAFICSSLIIWERRKGGINTNWIIWLIIALLCFFIAGEEISWGERITGIGIDVLRDANKQGESNIHNLRFFHLYLLDPAFEISCLILGWIGWRSWPKLDAFPAKRYSLYFLFVAFFFFYFDISYASTIKQIRNDQEIFETLMAIGLAAHSFEAIFKTRRKKFRIKNE
mgnify:CR=1 FL=1